MKNQIWFKICSWAVVICFFATLAAPAPAYAQGVPFLPPAGTMVVASPAFIPVLMKGIKVFPDNPLRLDFIMDTGNAQMPDAQMQEEFTRLIKYFLAGLTVPEEDLWVNLSPYEQDRIIPDQFGVTEMGRDLLAQDYILKQLTASLLYPEKELGKTFWDRVYAKVRDLYGTTEIPVNTFNKVWVVPDKAVVHQSGDVAFIMESHLKVMLEEDFLALDFHQKSTARSRAPARGEALDFHQKSTARPQSEANGATSDKNAQQSQGTPNPNPQPLNPEALSSNPDPKVVNNVTSKIVREILIPEIEKEVNEGRNFAQLRQIYHAMILATWFKRNLKESFLDKVYVGQNKVKGIDLADKAVREKIYKQYLDAFKKGVYNYIKEDYDPGEKQSIPRRYVAGGCALGDQAMAAAVTVEGQTPGALAAGAVETTQGEMRTTSVGLKIVTDSPENSQAASSPLPSDMPGGDRRVLSSASMLTQAPARHDRAPGETSKTKDDGSPHSFLKDLAGNKSLPEWKIPAAILGIIRRNPDPAFRLRYITEIEDTAARILSMPADLARRSVAGDEARQALEVLAQIVRMSLSSKKKDYEDIVNDLSARGLSLLMERGVEGEVREEAFIRLLTGRYSGTTEGVKNPLAQKAIGAQDEGRRLWRTLQDMVTALVTPVSVFGSLDLDVVKRRILGMGENATDAVSFAKHLRQYNEIDPRLLFAHPMFNDKKTVGDVLFERRREHEERRAAVKRKEVSVTPPGEEKPLAVFIVATEDFNGALNNLTAAGRLLQEGWDVLFYAARDIDEAIDAVVQATNADLGGAVQVRKARQVILSAHGGPLVINFSTPFRSDQISDEKIRDLSARVKGLVEGPVVLRSCSTGGVAEKQAGERGDLVYNVAQMLAIIFNNLPAGEGALALTQKTRGDFPVPVFGPVFRSDGIYLTEFLMNADKMPSFSDVDFWKKVFAELKHFPVPVYRAFSDRIYVPRGFNISNLRLLQKGSAFMIPDQDGGMDAGHPLSDRASGDPAAGGSAIREAGEALDFHQKSTARSRAPARGEALDFHQKSTASPTPGDVGGGARSNEGRRSAFRRFSQSVLIGMLSLLPVLNACKTNTLPLQETPVVASKPVSLETINPLRLYEELNLQGILRGKFTLSQLEESIAFSLLPGQRAIADEAYRRLVEAKILEGSVKGSVLFLKGMGKDAQFAIALQKLGIIVVSQEAFLENESLQDKNNSLIIHIAHENKHLENALKGISSVIEDEVEANEATVGTMRLVKADAEQIFAQEMVLAAFKYMVKNPSRVLAAIPGSTTFQTINYTKIDYEPGKITVYLYDMRGGKKGTIEVSFEDLGLTMRADEVPVASKAGVSAADLEKALKANNIPFRYYSVNEWDKFLRENNVPTGSVIGLALPNQDAEGNYRPSIALLSGVNINTVGHEMLHALHYAWQSPADVVLDLYYFRQALLEDGDTETLEIFNEIINLLQGYNSEAALIDQVLSGEMSRDDAQKALAVLRGSDNFKMMLVGKSGREVARELMAEDAFQIIKGRSTDNLENEEYYLLKYREGFVGNLFNGSSILKKGQEGLGFNKMSDKKLREQRRFYTDAPYDVSTEFFAWLYGESIDDGSSVSYPKRPSSSKNIRRLHVLTEKLAARIGSLIRTRENFEKHLKKYGAPVPLWKRQASVEEGEASRDNVDAVLKKEGRVYEGEKGVRKIATIFKNTPVYVMREHGDAYRAWEEARIQNSVNEPATLVHFDSHADMGDLDRVYPPSTTVEEARRISYSIESFIAPAVYNNYIDEIYWVLPEYAGARQEDQPGTSIYYVGLLTSKDNPDERLVYFHPEKSPDDRYRDISKKYNVSNIRPIVVHRVYAAQLPKFSLGKPIMLDIDEDYWMVGPAWEDNEGNIVGDKKWIEKDIPRIFDLLKEKQMQPYVVTVATSKGITPRDLVQPITKKILELLPTIRGVRHEEKTAPQVIHKGGSNNAGETSTPGGIDLDPNKMNLQTTGEGIDFNVPFDPAVLMDMPIDGFSPVILQIVPTNFPLLMGSSDLPAEELQMAGR